MAKQTVGNYVTRPKEEKKTRRKREPKEYVSRPLPKCGPGEVLHKYGPGNYKCRSKYPAAEETQSLQTMGPGHPGRKRYEKEQVRLKAARKEYIKKKRAREKNN